MRRREFTPRAKTLACSQDIRDSGRFDRSSRPRLPCAGSISFVGSSGPSPGIDNVLSSPAPYFRPLSSVRESKWPENLATVSLTPPGIAFPGAVAGSGPF